MSFLNALANCNRGKVPVWLMRQAGRYLPEYQALRAKHTLFDLFFTPKLAMEATLQPIRRFGFDAAILFSDITSIAPAMGFKLEFSEGPKVFPYAEEKKWRCLKQDFKLLDPIAEAALLTKQKLDVPLIGFCGGPFTIATYLTKKTWRGDDFTLFLDQITNSCIASLKRQIDAGVDAVQIFDSWANLLNDEEFETYSLKPLKKIIDSVDKPVIIYMRGSAKRAEQIEKLNPAAISVDWERPILEIRQNVKIAIQGNVNPELLFLPIESIRKKVRETLDEMEGDPGFIFNLGHGIKPKTPIKAVEALIQEIRF